MLHQIRRMIGMTIAVMRGKVSINMLENTFESPAMPTPTAPALGLILEKVRKVAEDLIWHEGFILNKIIFCSAIF